jgi:hypothetical protein
VINSNPMEEKEYLRGFVKKGPHKNKYGSAG